MGSEPEPASLASAGAADVADILGQLPSFVAVYEGADLRCVFANDVARGIVGGRDFVGLPLRQALPEFESQLIVDLVERVFHRGEPAQAREWRVQFDDPAGGPPIEVFANFDAVPWLHADGTLRGVITTGTIVTDMVLDRRRATQQVVDAEQRYRRARADVAELQRALLPSHVPVLPGAIVVAHYLVAAREQAAGGDWFDCMVLPGDRLALAVGDVVGHGLEASAAMGQLRAVLTELLTAGTDVAAALSRLDVFARLSPATRSATVCAAVVHLPSGEVRYSTLGHPAPLVVGPDGATRFLPVTGGTPLGSGDGDVVTRDAVLRPGEVLALFTDGLVERPGRSLDEGLAEFARVAAEAATRRLLPGGAAANAVERVCALSVEVLTRTGYSDDVTVLGLQLRESAPHPLLAVLDDGEQLGAMRTELADWLVRLGVDTADIGDVQLVATEAASNALEHAYGGSGGRVELSATLEAEGGLCLSVADRGRWRERSESASYRGRGLSLIRHFATDLTVEPTATGTTVRITVPLHRSAELSAEPPTPATVADEPDFEVAVALEPDPVVRVRGAIDLTTAGRFAAAIRTAARGGTRPVLVDLRETVHLASAGVRVLYETVQENRLSLLTTPGSSPEAVLRLVGLLELLSLDVTETG